MLALPRSGSRNIRLPRFLHTFTYRAHCACGTGTLKLVGATPTMLHQPFVYYIS